MIANIQLTMYVQVLVHVLYRYHKIKNPKQDPRLAPVADWQWENLYLFWIRVLLCDVQRPPVQQGAPADMISSYW